MPEKIFLREGMVGGLANSCFSIVIHSMEGIVRSIPQMILSVWTPFYENVRYIQKNQNFCEAL
jgi:hypothetical protein